MPNSLQLILERLEHSLPEMAQKQGISWAVLAEGIDKYQNIFQDFSKRGATAQEEEAQLEEDLVKAAHDLLFLLQTDLIIQKIVSWPPSIEEIFGGDLHPGKNKQPVDDIPLQAVPNRFYVIVQKLQEIARQDSNIKMPQGFKDPAAKVSSSSTPPDKQ
jgi:hypothetical protein